MPTAANLPTIGGATFLAIYQNSLDAILLTAPDGRIAMANPAACRLLERSEEEIRSLGRAGLMDASDERLGPALEERARVGRFSGELRMLRPGGRSFAAALTSALFTDEQGVTRTCTVIRDTSERDAEAQVRAREIRLETLRELSLGIRHEVNNSLAALNGELQLLLKSPTLGNEDRIGVKAALAVGGRIAAAIRRLEHVETIEAIKYLGTTRMLDLSPEPVSSAEESQADTSGTTSTGQRASRNT